MIPKSSDLEKTSDINLLHHFLENIKKGKLVGSSRKSLTRRGLIEYSHKHRKFQLTSKAHALLEST